MHGQLADVDGHVVQTGEQQAQRGDPDLARNVQGQCPLVAAVGSVLRCVARNAALRAAAKSSHQAKL